MTNKTILLSVVTTLSEDQCGTLMAMIEAFKDIKPITHKATSTNGQIVEGWYYETQQERPSINGATPACDAAFIVTEDFEHIEVRPETAKPIIK